MLTPALQTAATDPPVGPGKVAVTESAIFPWTSESGSRRPVETRAEAWGMETLPQGGGSCMEEVRPSGRGHISASRHDTLSALVLSDSSSPTSVECHGTDVAEAKPVCIFPDRSSPGSYGESLLVFGLDITLLYSSLCESPIRRDLLCQAGAQYLTPVQSYESCEFES